MQNIYTHFFVENTEKFVSVESYTSFCILQTLYINKPRNVCVKGLCVKVWAAMSHLQETVISTFVAGIVALRGSKSPVVAMFRKPQLLIVFMVSFRF